MSDVQKTTVGGSVTRFETPICEHVVFTRFLRVCKYVSCVYFMSIVGCAAIPNQATLQLESTPSGVRVASNTGWNCTTPCSRSVPRGSDFVLTFSDAQAGTVKRTISIPELKPSRSATYIGASIGALLMYISADVTSGLGGGIVSVLTGSTTDDDILSSGDKFVVTAVGALAGGGIGYAIDRARDRGRAKRPIRSRVVMPRSR